MSGATPACSQANSVPVRPQPVITSSAMNSTPWRAQIALHLGQHRGWIDQHAAGAEHQRLDDERRGVAARGRRPRARRASSCSRPRAGTGCADLEQQRLVGGVEHARARRPTSRRSCRRDSRAPARRCACAARRGCARSRAPSSARPRPRSSRCRRRTHASARAARSRAARAPAASAGSCVKPAKITWSSSVGLALRWPPRCPGGGGRGSTPTTTRSHRGCAGRRRSRARRPRPRSISVAARLQPVLRERMPDGRGLRASWPASARKSARSKVPRRTRCAQRRRRRADRAAAGGRARRTPPISADRALAVGRARRRRRRRRGSGCRGAAAPRSTAGCG